MILWSNEIIKVTEKDRTYSLTHDNVEDNFTLAERCMKKIKQGKDLKEGKC